MKSSVKKAVSSALLVGLASCSSVGGHESSLISKDGVKGDLTHQERVEGFGKAAGVLITQSDIYFLLEEGVYFRESWTTATNASLEDIVAPVCAQEDVEQCSINTVSGDYLDIPDWQINPDPNEPVERVSLALGLSYRHGQQECTATLNQPFNLYVGAIGLPDIQTIPINEPVEAECA